MSDIETKTPEERLADMRVSLTEISTGVAQGVRHIVHALTETNTASKVMPPPTFPPEFLDVMRRNRGMKQRHIVLVVDDEKDTCTLVKRLLAPKYDVITTSEPEEAFRIIVEQDVHVVLSDWMMPVHSGVEVLTKAMTAKPEAIRLLFSGCATTQAMSDAINEAHVHHFIAKPWDAREFEGMIEKACILYELQHETNATLDAATAAAMIQALPTHDVEQKP